MKTIPVTQGSGDWLTARLGIPTASCFGQIVKADFMPRTGEMPRTYLAQLVAERFVGQPLEDFSTMATERGQILEDYAIPWYELERGIDTTPAQFYVTDCGRAGASPDRLVGSDGLLEVKSPLALSKSANYIKTLLASDADAVAPYLAQIYGQLWILEREWCDLVLYHETLPRRITRVYRDDEKLATLAESVLSFADEVDEAYKSLTG